MRLAVKRGIQSGKVICFWNLKSRMFVADCFYPGCTEGMLDSEFLFPYIWQLSFDAHPSTWVYIPSLA